MRLNKLFPDGPPSAAAAKWDAANRATILTAPGSDYAVPMAHFAVTCGDRILEQDAGKRRQEVETLARSFPASCVVALVPYCQGFVPKSPALTDEILRRPLKQVLMLQQEADAATPYR